MKDSFYLLDLDHEDREDKTVIKLFGKTKDNKHVIFYDADFFPYFLAVIKGDPKKLKDKISKIGFVNDVEKLNMNYLGKEVEVLKISVNSQNDISKVKDIVKNMQGIEDRKETDYPILKRYLVEKDITPLQLLEVGHDEKNFIKSIKTKDEFLEKPDILAFDIETYFKGPAFPEQEHDPIISIALYGKIKKVLTWKKANGEEYVCLKNEEEMIERFVEEVKKASPDYLAGYFSDGFDFPYLKARANHHGISLDLGIDGSQVHVYNRGLTNKTRIKGINHLDILSFIRRVLGPTLKTESFDLNSVAEELIGKSKHDFDISKIGDMWDKGEIKKILDYNLQDAKITHQLCEKIIPSIHEFCKIVGQTPYEICRMSYGNLVESYLLKKAKDAKEIAPNRPLEGDVGERMGQTYKAAFVYTPEPGLYEDIVVFDYKGLYSSIIASYNIEATTLDSKGNKTIPIETESGKNVFYKFSKKEGFITKAVKEVIEKRDAVKKELKKKKDVFLEGRNYALKILANSIYGYLGFFGARWYCKEAAETIAAYGRYHIKQTISEAEKNNFKVLYSDTDSIFLLLGKKSKKDAMGFLDYINKKLPNYMELEFEDYYKRGIFVMKKGEELGAKKKYALINEKGEMKIVGFETVRRDWSLLARETQLRVIEIILKENNPKKAKKYVDDVINRVKSRKIELPKLVIKTKLTKALGSYANVGPHVAVALRMKNKGIFVGPGSMIEYIISDKGGKNVRDKARLIEECKNGEYDVEYYLDNQILPATEKIFEALGYEKKDILKKKEQPKLGDFS